MLYNIKNGKKSLPLWQLPRPEKTVPSGHTHATVRVGSVSLTTHVCSPVQGLFTLHGFWQDLSMQASFV